MQSSCRAYLKLNKPQLQGAGSICRFPTGILLPPVPLVGKETEAYYAPSNQSIILWRGRTYLAVVGQIISGQHQRPRLLQSMFQCPVVLVCCLIKTETKKRNRSFPWLPNHLAIAIIYRPNRKVLEIQGSALKISWSPNDRADPATR